MNITFSADAGLTKKAHEYAKAHNTSLNQLVRDYLRRVACGGDIEKAADEFMELARTMPGCSDSGFKFSRDTVDDRHLDK